MGERGVRVIGKHTLEAVLGFALWIRAGPLGGDGNSAGAAAVENSGEKRDENNEGDGDDRVDGLHGHHFRAPEVFVRRR